MTGRRARALAAHWRREAAEVLHRHGRMPWAAGAAARLLARAEQVSP